MSVEIALELRARKLERCVLASVCYQRNPYVAVPPPAWATREPHAIDSAYLRVDDGRQFRVAWADELDLRLGFGVAIAEQRVIDRDLGPIEDVSAELGWRALIGRRISACYVHWDEIERAMRSTFKIMVAIHATRLTRPDYPQAIQLDFEGGDKKLFAAASIRETGEIERFTNQLLVSDSE